MNEREIFVAATAISDPLKRDRFLQDVCDGDPAKLHRIKSLIAAGDKDDSFLQAAETQDAVPADSLTRIGKRIGPYKLLEKIGEGGFGTVFVAEQLEPVRRMVAVKVIKPGMDSRQVIARFEAERQALAIMDHPNIAKVLQAGTTQSGLPYFVMELVKGVPITEFCDQRKLTLNERLNLFVSVCNAIQHAHSKGIIHRDIKPGNVLVALYDNQPVPKVIDFGVAKATGQQLTERTLHTGFGAVVGSIEYMSPEQANLNQLDIDTRSDVYSLGVLLYELLTGGPPLAASELRRIGLMESLRMIREAEPARPSVRLSTDEGLASLAANRALEPARLMSIVKGDLDWIVMRALDKDRHRRYETVDGLGQEISRFLRGEPVLAHPPSRIYRLRKFARHYWRELSVAAVMALLVGAVVFLVFRHANQQARQLAAHSARVTTAMNDANLALNGAQNAPIGQQAQWVAARGAAARLQELLSLQPVGQPTQSAAQSFLADYRRRDSERQLAEHIENVVIMSATNSDLQSWQRMEQQFCDLFCAEGIDVDSLTPAEVAQRIRGHHSAPQLCDALELWIGTRGQIAALGGPPATRASMQPLADAMLAADDDPLRTGIRRLIYAGQPPTVSAVDAIVKDVQLAEVAPRTLSWLATVYQMAGATQRSDDVFHLAVNRYPDDLMLNFDFAYMLQSQQRWEGAIRYYLRCTALRPDVAGIWRGLGNAYRENDELQRAREALQRAVDLAPELASVRVDLARTLMELGDFAAAETAARQAIQLGSQSPRSQFCLGQALLNQQRFAEALVALKACDRLNQEDPQQAVSTTPLIDKCKRGLAASEGADLRRLSAEFVDLPS